MSKKGVGAKCLHGFKAKLRKDLELKPHVTQEVPMLKVEKTRKKFLRDRHTCSALSFTKYLHRSTVKDGPLYKETIDLNQGGCSFVLM